MTPDGAGLRVRAGHMLHMAAAGGRRGFVRVLSVRTRAGDYSTARRARTTSFAISARIAGGGVVGGVRRGRPGRGAGVVLMCAVVVLAGCGGSTSPPAAPTPTPTPTATPEEQAFAWTESVCGALVPVIAGLTAAPGVDLAAPEATRQAYLTYLADGIATTDRARAALAAAGPAPVPDGDVLAEQVRGDVAELRTDLVDARTQVERAEPDSAVALGRALVGASSLVRALLNGAEVAGTVTRDPLLRDAYARAPSCARLQRSGATPPTTAPAAEPTR